MILPDRLGDLTDEQQRVLLQKLLRQRAAEQSRFAMSVQQQGLWYGYRRDPASTAYNVFLPARIRSPIDVEAFHQTIDLLVQRHASLRTTFSDEGGQLVQQVHEEMRPEFRVIEVGGLTDDEIREWVVQETGRPFDLENDPMLRLTLFRRRDDDWITLACTHHIVVDFWSLVLLLSEMRQAYLGLVSGRDPELSPAPDNYASFVQQQQQKLDAGRGRSLRRYWRQQLEGSPHVTELPTDFIRPQRFTGRAEVVSLEFESDLVQRMSQLAMECGATFQALVLALLQTLIHRYTGQSSFQIGSPFAGRLQREYEQTVGFFVNMLPLRADLSGELTFVQLVQRASRTLVEALEHEDLPLAEIVRELEVSRDTSRSPLFQVTCTFEKSHLKQEQGRAAYLFPAEAQRAKIGGLEQESFWVPVQTCRYDMEFIFERSDDGLRGMICYCRDLFAHDTMQMLASHLQELAEQLVRHPTRPLADVSWTSQSLTSQSRKTQPLTALPESESDNPDRPPLMLLGIDEIAKQNPARVALSSPPFEQSYTSLVADADIIAQSLAARGIGPGSYVPVVGKRGPELIAALLGVIRSGAAVVPIDADQPAVGQADLIEDTDARLVIVGQSEDWKRMSDRAAEADIEVVTIGQLTKGASRESVCIDSPPPADLCYLIYTSGSSGRPKGVMIEHAAIDNTLRWRSKTVPVNGDDRILILLSHQFDAGFGIILSSLVQGAGLVWSDHPTSDVDAIVDLILRESITVLPTIPTLLSLILDHPRFAQCTSLRQVWVGGEAMPADLPQRLRERCRLPLWNFYGPTEAAVEATAANVIDQDSRRIVPIGVAVDETEILVLDSNRRPLPPTVPGELAIGGPGLARGYLKRPRLTAERFPTLADGRRVFLTGDRGRQRVDGAYEFLGRTDHQIKLGGHRIELEEIEQVLRSCDAVVDAAVKVKESSNSPASLIAYITLRESAASVDDATPQQANSQVQDVQQHVASRLPSFKRPRRYQVLAELPRTSSGKVDRKRLPELDDQQVDQCSHVPPRTPLERYLADAWAKMLGLSLVGIDQDFFELGGTSLQAATNAAQLSDELGVHVPTSLLFDLADISQIAERLVELHRDQLAIRFGVESVSIYRDGSQAPARSRPASGHPLIADLRQPADGDDCGAECSDQRRSPMFMVHPPGGIVVCYRELAKRCAADQPFYAIRSRGLHGQETLPGSVEEMAAEYIQAIKTVAPTGPYQLGGWSLGGIVACEVAKQLSAAGESVERLVLLDTAIPTGSSDLVAVEDQTDAGLEYGLEMTLDELVQLQPNEQLPLLWEHAKNLGVLDDDTPQEVVDRALQDLKHLFHHHIQVIGQYKIEPLQVPLLLVRPRDVPMDVGTAEDRGWSAIANDLKVEFVSGHHHSMVQPPNVDAIARLLL